MKIFIRIESIEHERFKEFSSIRNDLEKSIQDLLNNANYGGTSIEVGLYIILRIYPKQRFDAFPQAYKPVFQYSRKNKTAKLSYDFNLEDILSLARSEVWNMFNDGAVLCIERLREINIIDVKVEALVNDINQLKDL